MTRSDLVTRLAEQFSQLTHRDTEFAVKTVLDAMSADTPLPFPHRSLSAFKLGKGK